MGVFVTHATVALAGAGMAHYTGPVMKFVSYPRIAKPMKIGITCYPTYGGSGVVATELGMELAARGHEIHFISYAPPVRLDSARGEASSFTKWRFPTYPLFDHAPYTLTLAVKMLEVARVGRARSAARALRHSAFGERDAGAVHGRSAATPRLPFVTTLHGTDITLVGNDRSFLPITRFSIEQSDGVTAISQYLKTEDHRGVRHQAAHRGDSQLRQLRSLLPQGRSRAARRMGARRRAHPDAPLEFPSGEARYRRGGDIRAACGKRCAPSWC